MGQHRSNRQLEKESLKFFEQRYGKDVARNKAKEKFKEYWNLLRLFRPFRTRNVTHRNILDGLIVLRRYIHGEDVETIDRS